MSEDLSAAGHIYPLVKEACDSCGVTGPTCEAMDRGLTNELANILAVLVVQMDPKRFYQSFCSIWQTYEYYVLSDAGLSESDFAQLVCRIAQGLVEKPANVPTFVNANLRAMCMSFIMNSLHQHPLTEAYAIRMLLLFATKCEVSSNEGFIQWVLQYVERRIDRMVQISDGRPLFVATTISFFAAIPADKYNTACVKCALRFLGTAEFRKMIVNPGKEANKVDRNLMTEELTQVATRIINTALTAADEFFLCEMMEATEVIMKYLSEKQKELLNIFVSGNADDFERFNESNSYVKDNNLDLEVLRFKIQVLTLVSLCEGKSTVSLAELKEALKRNDLEMRQLIVKVNQTDIAKLKINGVANEVIIEYSQPRKFSNDTWIEMADRLDKLMQSIN